jgi:hypothetical protein
MVLRLLTGDARSPHFVRDVSAIDDFVDLRGLFYGPDTVRALRERAVRLVPAYVEDAGIPAGSIGLVTSRSVLEHVTETERCFDALAAMVAPGGVMCHHIDLTAHDESDRFAFYYAAQHAGGRRPDGLNGLRLSDYVTAFSARGFACQVVEKTIDKDYDLARRPLLPRFARYSEDDLRCGRAALVCVKRG